MSSFIRRSLYRLSYDESFLRGMAYVLEGAAGAVVLAWIFYNSLLAAIPMSLVVPVYVKLRRRGYVKKKENELLMQFREGMNAAAVALRAGYSVENSFIASGREMRMMYGEKAAVCRLFDRIEAQLAVNGKIEDALAVYADNSGIDDIISFSEVFSYAKRSGGNMVEIMQDTVLTIGQKADTAREISVLISEKQLEQAIMDAAPIGIILYLRAAAPELIGKLYGNAMGITVMTICFLVYAAAVVLSLKIADIRV